MGLFNYVNVKHKCPVCKTIIGEWQSKELTDINGYWIDNYMTAVEFDHIKDGEIHTICNKCNYYIALRIHDGVIGELIEKNKVKTSRAVKRILKEFKKGIRNGNNIGD